jgi:hypothetical protein
MEEFITYLIVAAVSFMIGHRVSTIFHVLSFKKILEELGITREQMIRLAQKNGLDVLDQDKQPTESLEVIHIKLEQHQGQIYAFRKDNDGFLGQGSDREQLISALKQRMNNVRLIVDEGSELLQKNNG